MNLSLQNKNSNNDCHEPENIKLNSYLPCISWGKCAKDVSKLKKNDNIFIYGELRSREYKKPLQDGTFEIRVAHELLVTDFYVIGKENEE